MIHFGLFKALFPSWGKCNDDDDDNKDNNDIGFL